ncbi:MAG: hypothetical protein AAGI68_08025 [Planctomycetota bacterium]
MLLTNKIIAGALMGGLTVVTCMMIFINGGKATPFSVVTALGLVIGVVCILASLLLPASLAKASRTETTQADDPLAAEFSTMLIVRLALLEGGGVINAVLFFLNPWWPQLALIGLMLGIMAINFPTENRWRDYLETREREDELGER